MAQAPVIKDSTGQAIANAIQGLNPPVPSFISDAFSVERSYSTGDIVIYENKLYKFTSDKSAGAWDSTKVTETTIGAICTATNASLTQNYYTKTATDNLLDDKLNASNLVTVDNGTFAGLVKPNEVWLIIVQRISTAATCVLVASNYQGTINVKEIVKDSGFTYLTNNQGTINIKYSDSNQGVYGGAYKLK